MRWMFVLLALAAGALMPVQAGINNTLKGYMQGSAAMAALVSFFVGTVALLVWVLVQGGLAQGLALSVRGPWWIFSGGVLGAFFVAATVLLAAKLGAASMMAWLVAGQLIASLLLDQSGSIGYMVREISWPRVLGAVLLVAGAVLMEKY